MLVDGVDPSLAQISAFLACHYKAYEREQSNEDRLAYPVNEMEARLSKKGLWSTPNLMPPWEFRNGPPIDEKLKGKIIGNPTARSFTGPDVKDL